MPDHSQALEFMKQGNPIPTQLQARYPESPFGKIGYGRVCFSADRAADLQVLIFL
jgi:hypothetical protein